VGELAALDDAGSLALIFATKPGDGLEPHPRVAQLAGRVVTLPPGSASQQAELVAAHLHGTEVAAVHGYFAHTPADVAARAAERLGIPFGFSAHARDARKVEPDELTRRGRGASVVIACNTDVAATLRERDVAAELVPHGVDSSHFVPRHDAVSGRDRVRLLAVGRLVEKKGFAILLSAVARLAIPFSLRIVGEGPEHGQLRREIERLGLVDRVTLAGGRTHADLPDEYADADLVVVPSVLDRTGDRDGLPNVVLEAMAAARPVVASRIAAIPTAVVHRQTGLLVDAGDAAALAEAIRALAADAILRERLGQAGRARVVRDFGMRECTDRLRRVLEAAYV
jgi:glycosyltransferase involved in cell wall biosynthesis